MRRRSISSREFNQNTSGAKKAAEEGPVFITDRGRPAHVLLTYQAYLDLTSGGPSLGELLSMPAETELELPRFEEVARPAKLD